MGRVDFKNIAYLEQGDEVQVKAYKVLKKSHLMTFLAPYAPILVGTIPIGIYTDNSDLDILCYVEDFKLFEDELLQFCGYGLDLLVKHKLVRGVPTVIIEFMLEGLEIQIFGQTVLPNEQYGYRHMMIEAKLLALYGAGFQRLIVDLKKQGVKTEPAFAKLLGLEGDPYESLLTLEHLSDEKLLEFKPL